MLGEAISSPHRCFFQISSLHNCVTLCWNVLFLVSCCWNSYSCSRQRRKESGSFYKGFLRNLWNRLLFEYCSAVGLGCSLLFLPLADRLNWAMSPWWGTEGDLQAWQLTLVPGKVINRSFWAPSQSRYRTTSGSGPVSKGPAWLIWSPSMSRWPA